MLKKIIIGIFIIALLIALSYLKTIRENNEKKSAYKRGQGDTELTINNYKQDIDSLNQAIRKQELTFTDSIVQNDNNYQKEIDSLNKEIDDQSREINSLLKKVRTSQQNSQKKTSSSKTLSKHEKIYQYYKKRYTSLPKDLSSYEKKIVINEIREETAQKFSISLSELEQIRKKYNLNY